MSSPRVVKSVFGCRSNALKSPLANRLQKDRRHEARGPHQATDRVRLGGIFRPWGKYNRSLLFSHGCRDATPPTQMLTIE